MITIVIPTRNRADTLAKVANSYYKQEKVTEIIFVDDFGNDNTHEVVTAIAANYPQIKTHYLKHTERKGAAAGRITGYTNATNEYILFGEDDAFLEQNYSSCLFEKYHANNELGLVSGRIIYMLHGETPQNALSRFGSGLKPIPYLNPVCFALNKDALVTGDFTVPFTHAIFLTTKTRLEKFSFDPFYAKGNGYREETDYQLNLFSNNYKLLVTNDTHCYHLHGYDAPSGGQRISRFGKLFWNVYYTNYLYDKYFDQIKYKLNINYPRVVAKVLFASYQFYLLFIRPIRKLPQLIHEKFYR